MGSGMNKILLLPICEWLIEKIIWITELIDEEGK